MVQLFPSREVFLSVGIWNIYWYGVAYVLALWLVWWSVWRLQQYRQLTLTREQWTYLLLWGFAGALIGGRLGYVVLYEPAYYWTNPAHAFALWEGGMASHGGIVGGVIAVWLLARQWRRPVLALFDVLAVPAAIGLALGRVANFINLELYGGYSALIAAGALVLVAVVCWIRLRHSVQTGHVSGLFLFLYSGQRLVLEMLRIDGWTGVWGLSRGQLLTVPLLLIGLWLLLKTRSQTP